MAKGEADPEPIDEVFSAQVVPNSKSESKKRGNLSLAPMVARGMAPMTAARALDGKAKTVNSPPQNLQDPLKALFGDRIKNRKPK